jgi:hypothetical protein
MLTRAQLLEQYDIGPSGMITTLGKFEAEPLYVPYFWECGMEGSADEDHGPTLGFKVEPVTWSSSRSSPTASAR